MFDLSLENCRVNRDLTVNIGVDDGKIVQISRGRIDASERIDLKGYFVLPGLIDSHVHFRDP
ncbi:MAG: dihydroorotase, partial [Methanothermobacter sp.]|nr:dihydroorotase [Methanothermobacter sp.]